MTKHEAMQVPAINHIDRQLSLLDPESTQAEILLATRDFRSSWLNLGRLLKQVAYGGDYKEWGYESFELYCARALGLKKPTVKKLMVSYSYMQSRHQALLDRSETAATEAERPTVPDYQTIELLHRAHENNIVDEEALREVEARVFAGDVDEGFARQEIRGMLKPAGIPAVERSVELDDIRKTARLLRRKLDASAAVPEGLRERMGEMLDEVEDLD